VINLILTDVGRPLGHIVSNLAGYDRLVQDVQEVLRLCTPCRADFVGRYTFVEFYPVPNLRGLSLIAIDGKLVSARRWSCTKNEALFETISEDDRKAAFAAYEPRVFGYRR